MNWLGKGDLNWFTLTIAQEHVTKPNLLQNLTMLQNLDMQDNESTDFSLRLICLRPGSGKSLSANGIYTWDLYIPEELLETVCNTANSETCYTIKQVCPDLRLHQRALF